MHEFDGPKRRSAPSHRLSLAGVILVGVTIIAAGLTIWDRREESIASYRREITNLGTALSEQTARSMQAVDLVLKEIQAEVVACPDLDTAVQRGFAWARPDGVVLLSPAAPSFGQFRDYRDRGDAFARAMRACSAG